MWLVILFVGKSIKQLQNDAKMTKNKMSKEILQVFVVPLKSPHMHYVLYFSSFHPPPPQQNSDLIKIALLQNNIKLQCV